MFKLENKHKIINEKVQHLTLTHKNFQYL